MPKFLLDACLPFGASEFASNDFIRSTDILPCNALDETVFYEAKKRGLIVVTRDSGFIVRALLEQKNIVYQSEDGQRYLVGCIPLDQKGSTKSMKKTTKYLLTNDEIIIP